MTRLMLKTKKVKLKAKPNSTKLKEDYNVLLQRLLSEYKKKKIVEPPKNKWLKPTEHLPLINDEFVLIKGICYEVVPSFCALQHLLMEIHYFKTPNRKKWMRFEQ